MAGEVKILILNAQENLVVCIFIAVSKWKESKQNFSVGVGNLSLTLSMLTLSCFEFGRFCCQFQEYVVENVELWSEQSLGRFQGCAGS